MAKGSGTTKYAGSAKSAASNKTSSGLSLYNLGDSELRSFKFENGVVAEASYKSIIIGDTPVRVISIEAWVPKTSSTPLNELGFFRFPYSDNAEIREALQLFDKDGARKAAESQLAELQKRKFKK